MFLKFFIVYAIVFLFLYLTCFLYPSKTGKIGLQTNLRYIKKKYGLKLEGKRVRTFSKILIGVDSIVLSIGIFLAMFLDIDIVLGASIAFVTYMVLLIVLYNLVGLIMKKKGW